MTAANDPNLERWHLVEQLLAVLDEIVTSTRLVVTAGLRGRVLQKSTIVIISLLAFLFSCTLILIFIGLLTPLK